MAGNKVGAALGSAGAITDVDSVQRNPLGSEFDDENGNTYTYIKGVASLAAGDWIIINADGTVARAVSTPLSGPAGVAMAAIDATHYGWAQIDGVVSKTGLGNSFQSSNIATDAAADKKPLYLSATAGRATTTQAAGNAILGAWGSGAAAANVGDALLARPFAPGFTLASA